MLNVVTANVWLEASSEDAGKPLTFHGTQATSLAIPRHARFLFGARTRGLHPWWLCSILQTPHDSRPLNRCWRTDGRRRRTDRRRRRKDRRRRRTGGRQRRTDGRRRRMGIRRRRMDIRRRRTDRRWRRTDRRRRRTDRRRRRTDNTSGFHRCHAQVNSLDANRFILPPDFGRVSHLYHNYMVDTQFLNMSGQAKLTD